MNTDPVPETPAGEKSGPTALHGLALLCGLLALLLFFSVRQTGRARKDIERLARHGTHIERGQVDLCAHALAASADSTSAWGYVEFKTPFKEIPEVMLGLEESAGGAASGPGVRLTVTHAEPRGFGYELRGPGVTRYERLIAKWAAFDRRTPNNAIGLGTALTEREVSLFDGALRLRAFERGLTLAQANGLQEALQLAREPSRLAPVGDISVYCSTSKTARDLGAPLEGEHSLFFGEFRLHVFDRGVILWERNSGRIDLARLDRPFRPDSL